MRMRTWIWAGLLGLIGGWPGCSSPLEPQIPHVNREFVRPALGQQIDEYVTRASAFGFRGVVLAAAQGRVVLAKGYGLASDDPPVPHSLETLFDIGSIAKMFTAASILGLETKGQLDRNDPLPKFFDDVPEDKQEITLAQILSHTSGLAREADGDAATDDPDALRRAMLATPLEFEPGTDFAYSNAGYRLLAMIVETKVEGGFRSEVERSLLAPAEMTNTGFFGDPRWREGAAARGYMEGEDAGSLADWPFSWRSSGNGGMVSTVSDLYRWSRVFRRASVIPPESVSAMTRGAALNDGGRVEYGLGVEISTGPRGERALGHGGDHLGYHALLRWFPDLDATIIVLTNEGQVFSGLGNHRAISRGLERLILGQSLVVPFPEVTQLAPEEWEELWGEYDLADGGRLVLMKTPGGPRLVPMGPGATELLWEFNAEERLWIDPLVARTRQIIAGVRDGDLQTVRELAGKNGEFHVGALRELLVGKEAELGSLERVQVLGGVPVNWSRVPRVRVFVRFWHERGGWTMNYGWQEQTIFDFTEWSQPWPHGVPVAAGSKSQLLRCDLWTKRVTSIAVVRDALGRPEGLRFGPGEGALAVKREQKKGGSETGPGLGPP